MIQRRHAVIAVAIALFVILLSHSVWAQIGQIKNVAGQVSLVRNNVQQSAKTGDLLEQADVLTTGPNGSVGITFIDNTRFSAGPNSRIELKQFNFNPTTQEGDFVTDVRQGTLAIISGQIAKRSPDAMKVRTPTTILGVRGTKFAIKVDERAEPVERHDSHEIRFFWSGVACLGTLLLAACSTTKTLVVLLPEESGTSGAVSVGEAAPTAVLDAPLTSATVDARGNVDKATVTQEEVQRTFGQALAAQPPNPLSFTLYFSTASTEVTPESQPILEALFAEVAKRQAVEVQVTG